MMKKIAELSILKRRLIIISILIFWVSLGFVIKSCEDKSWLNAYYASYVMIAVIWTKLFPKGE